MNEKKNNEFIRENVVKKKDLKQKMKHGFFFCLQAITFGVLVAVVYAWMEPRAQQFFSVDEHIEIKHSVIETVENASEKNVEGETEPSDITRQEKFNPEELKDSLIQIRGVETGTDSESNKAEDKVQKDNDIYKNEKYASAVVLSNDGPVIALTRYSVIAESGINTVEFSNGLQCKAEFLAGNKELDVAVISISVEEFLQEKNYPPAVTVGDSEAIVEGQSLEYIGCSEGVGTFLSEMQMVAKCDDLRVSDGYYSVYATNLPMNFGENGFAFNKENQLVGMITTLTRDSIPNMVTFIGMRDLTDLIQNISNGRGVPSIGVNGVTVSDEMRTAGAEKLPDGVYVESVTESLGAYRAGILKGDVIVKIDDTEITSAKQTYELVTAKEIGMNISVQVMRYGKDGYQPLEFEVQVMEKKG